MSSPISTQQSTCVQLSNPQSCNGAQKRKSNFPIDSQEEISPKRIKQEEDLPTQNSGNSPLSILSHASMYFSNNHYASVQTSSSTSSILSPSAPAPLATTQTNQIPLLGKVPLLEFLNSTSNINELIKVHGFELVDNRLIHKEEKINIRLDNQNKITSIYHGEFDQTTLLANGKGTCTCSNGTKYEGTFFEGDFHGQGTLTYPNGDKLVGEFKNNKFYNGQGTFTYPDGSKYQGTFFEEKPHGQGILTYSDGRKYEGTFFEGKRHGQGTLTYPDGRKYQGTFFEGKPHGQGTLTYPDGDKFLGEFKNDIFYNGQATSTYLDGRKYEGTFFEGKRHGPAKVYYPNGDILKGNFLHGNWPSQGIYISHNKIELRKYNPLEQLISAIPLDTEAIQLIINNFST